MNKKVTLVGAGPGELELISLKGIKAIKNADVILYDSLANAELLEFAKPNTLKLFVGKRNGSYVYTQDEINQLLVAHAMEGNQVVRLKGGDPFVFGRGYEEVQYAQSFGIETEVVSGISSAIAVPASVGIPVTSRGFAESFWVITGTTKTGSLSKDIKLAAQSSATVVILMGMSRLERICQLFDYYGKGNTPMAIIQNGTHQNAVCVIAPVKEMYNKSVEKSLANPAVIVIGEVVGLHNDYKMYMEYIENEFIK